MSAIITSVGSVVTAAVGWVGQFVTVVEDNPIILLFTVLPLVGLGIGLLKRLLSVN